VGASSLGASTGANNTAMGFGTLGNAYGESNSIAIGYLASFNSNSSTGYNTVIGTQALYGSSQSTGNTGSDNLVAGAKAMYYNTSGSNNAALGFEAMYENTTGTGNAAMGDNAMPANTSGSYNQAAGDLALFSNTTGSENAGSGAGVLEDNTTGNFNVAMGYLTLYENTTGSYNTALGTFANTSTSGLSNATALGSDATVTASNKVVIGSTSVTSIGGYAGWSNFSDGRYKKNIQQNVPGLAFINKLNAITYTLDLAGIETKLHENDKQSADKKLPSRPSYLDDPVMKQAVQEKSAIIYTGFVAQDVEKAADSVGFTFSGVDKPKDVNQSFYGLRYSDFVVPLVKAVQELSASSNSKDSAINVLQGRFDSLQSQVNELRALLLAKNTTAMSGASLDQNMPNPFNGATIIGYNLPKGATSAQMQITDITGKVLAVIPLSGEGKSSVTANISGYAAGIYTYSLIVNGQIVGTKEMTAIR
jgi:trimeric autotransporter adhesin